MRSCESKQAVVHWRACAEAVRLDAIYLTDLFERAKAASTAARYTRKADAIERRLSGTLHVTTGSPRLPKGSR